MTKTKEHNTSVSLVRRDRAHGGHPVPAPDVARETANLAYNALNTRNRLPSKIYKSSSNE